ncbi:MAG: M48 family metallopeptidase [Acidimicrobiales bacterium]
MACFALFTLAFIFVVAYAFGFGAWASLIAIVVTIASTWVGYWKSDSIALAVSRAKPATVEEYARLHNLVEGLCIASGLPKPRLYVVHDDAPNAFATGRNPQHAAIAVTTGLLQKLNRVELEGVLAHELSHIKNYDILVSTLAVTMVGIIALVADLSFRFMFWGGIGGRRRDNDSNNNPAGAILVVVGLVLLIVAPIVAKVMQLAVSRRREALADFSGVEMTRYPPGLISALEKLKADSTVVHSSSRATAHLWIEEPTPQSKEQGRLSWLNRLFATHPPLDERIAALREL